MSNNNFNYYSADPKGNYNTQPATGYAPPQYGQQYGQQHSQQYQVQPQQPYYQPPPSTAYAPPPPAASYYPPPPPPDVQTSSASKFEKNPKFKDLWASLLFVLHLAGFGVAAYFGIAEFVEQVRNPQSALNKPKSGTGLSSIALTSTMLGITLGSSLGVGIVFSLIYYFCMQRFTGKMIHVTFFIAVAIFGAFAIYLLYLRNFVGGVITLIFAVIYAAMYYFWRSRIPFARLMLRTVCSITNQFPGMLMVAFTGLLVSCVFNAIWVCTLMGLFFKYTAYGQTSYGAFYGLIVFLVFSLYWTTQVIYNTIHVAISGVFATFYFMGTSAAGTGVVTVPVSHPVAASSKRAVTTAFGSVCFGSLIIALIQTIQFLIRSAASESMQDGNFFAYFCLMCVHCLLQWIEDLLEYFNQYAYAQVAIYGKDFCTAAKDTWKLVKSHGIDAIINDNLIGNVLFVGSMVCGLICGLIGYFYLVNSGVNPTTYIGTYVIIIIACVFIGLSEFGVLNTVIDSGVVTTFVCLAEDPMALARTKPELYNKIREVYPDVMLGGF